MTDISVGWHVGRKEIRIFMGKQFKVYSWRTVRRWKKRGMPYHNLWSGQPYIIENEVINWQMRRKT